MKKLTSKLHLSKETLRNLSERDLSAAVGGLTWRCTGTCEPTSVSECDICPTDTCLSGGSCPTGGANCC